MLKAKLIDCPECESIPVLLEEIDCKITEQAKKAYNNLVYALGKTCSNGSLEGLMHYRRILRSKQLNPEYASSFSVEDIASKVKLLIHKKNHGM